MMKRIPIELKSKATTSHVPLAAVGYALGRAGVLSPLHDVALPIKAFNHSPGEKLIEAVVLILAGGRATWQAELLVCPNESLARGWGQEQFAAQATLARTLDAFDEVSIARLRTAFEAILRSYGGALSHDYRSGDLWLDGDLTGLPASRRAEGSTKGYFAGKKTVSDANWHACVSGPMARHWGLCSIPARNTRLGVCNRWYCWLSV
jgi:hypothetical protein